MSGLETSELHLYSLQMTWFCWLLLRDLQRALRRFAAECEAVEMTVSTSKSEAMVLCRKLVGKCYCPK